MTKRALLYIFIFLMPFLVVVGVNEMVRLNIDAKPHNIKVVTTINPITPSTQSCSWNCYYNTNSHCKTHHTKLLKPYFRYIDPFYFGIIKTMHTGGNYQLMNVVFLVVLVPLLIFIMLVSAVEMGCKIKALKKDL